MQNTFFKLAHILNIHKWKIIFLFFIGALSYTLFYLAKPKSEIVIGVQIKSIDSQTNEPVARYKGYHELKTKLAEKGIQLKYTTQRKIGRDEAAEKPDLEALIDSDSDADFVYGWNTGANLDEKVTKNFSSLGAMSQTPILMFVRKGDGRIKVTKDLIGKKIIFWSSPEGHDKPLFSSSEVKASVYSDDYILESLFERMGVTPSNTKITNSWPKPVSIDQDWDVWVTYGMPSKDSHNNVMYSSVINHQVEFLNLEDLPGVSRNLHHLKLSTIPASTFNPSANVPTLDLPVLMANRGVIVRNGLDPVLVLGLTEAFQGMYSKPTLLNEKDEFPNFLQDNQFKPNPVALDYYKNGPPLLNKYLPPNISAFVTKLLFIFLPLFTIIWPLLHFLPSIYGFYVKHKITHWYRDLEILEKIYPTLHEDERQHYLDLIREIEEGIQNLRLPIMHSHYVQELFHARAHIELTKQKLGIKN